MSEMQIKALNVFRRYLMERERSENTVVKYLRDVEGFFRWLGCKEHTRKEIIEYKKHLMRHYSPATVNSKISSLNCFFESRRSGELKVKSVKLQHRIFADEERELTKSEYQRLLCTAKSKKNERLYLLMQTICSCGIRVSELKFITAEAVMRGRAEIECKGKRRSVFIPGVLCKLLKRYMDKRRIWSGSVFITRSGSPLDRSNIWSEMKKLCREAGVSEKKVFPHNLRHLFARTYYEAQKDIVKLADILGHSSINTTRIYTMESGEVHRRQIEKLGLLRC